MALGGKAYSILKDCRWFGKTFPPIYWVEREACGRVPSEKRGLGGNFATFSAGQHLSMQ